MRVAHGLPREFKIKKTMSQKNYGIDSERIVSSLEVIEDEWRSSVRRDFGSLPNGSSFIENGCPRGNKIKCHLCDKFGQKMHICFYNRRSKKYSDGWKRTSLIEAKL